MEPEGILLFHNFWMTLFPSFSSLNFIKNSLQELKKKKKKKFAG